MNAHLNQDHIIHLVEGLMTARGTRKVKLGEVLGIDPAATSQAKVERANRFLGGKQKSVSIDELNALADFFEKPITDFLGAKITDRTLAQDVTLYRTTDQGELDTVLVQMGLPSDARQSVIHLVSLLQK